MDRIYEIKSGSWKQVVPGKWEFETVQGRALNEQEIDAAWAAGELPLRPGDHCPTRAGGAHRPLWF